MVKVLANLSHFYMRRVLRSVHPLPRGHRLAGPGGASHRARSGSRPRIWTCSTASPAASAGAPSAPWGMPRPCRCRASSSTTAHEFEYHIAHGAMCIGVERPDYDGQDQHRDRRPHLRGRPRRDDHRGRGPRGHRHPALLLSQEALHRRQLPHVPGGGGAGRAPLPQAGAGLRHPGRPRHEDPDPLPQGPGGPAAGPWSSCSSITRWTVPSATRAGSASCRTWPWAMAATVSRYAEGKRVVMDEDLGPLIATEMTRCIHCTRCVRFGAEIAGVRELGATGRGEDMRIGTFVAHTVAHELSGNIIDLCPVGALTSKPYRFTARAWELTQAEGIAPHDGLGSNLELHLRGNRVMRVHPRDNEAVNETWISDRDRFSYQGLTSADRLTAAHGQARRGLASRSTGRRPCPGGRAAQGRPRGPAQTRLADLPQCDPGGAVPGPEARAGPGLCQHRSPPASARLPRRCRWIRRCPGWGCPSPELEALRGRLLIGSDIRQEQPLLAHRIRKAAADGRDSRPGQPARPWT